VFGERYTWEYTELGPQAMRRSWFGDDASHKGEKSELFYDHLETPFPGSPGAGAPAADVARAMRSAGAHWSAGGSSGPGACSRAGTLFYDPTKDAETIAELKEEGFLGDGF
jgi:hypothetical protein